jgi:hypothetical protein
MHEVLALLCKEVAWDTSFCVWIYQEGLDNQKKCFRHAVHKIKLERGKTVREAILRHEFFRNSEDREPIHAIVFQSNELPDFDETQEEDAPTPPMFILYRFKIPLTENALKSLE